MVLVASFSCKDATQARVVLRTNVPYQPGISVALWANGASDAADPAVVSNEPWLADGELGDVMITPQDQKDERLALRVVLGIRRDPRTCTRDNAAGCIVARRNLAFVPHAALRVPVVMHLACDGVVCDDSSTCDYLGKCVSAAVDPLACASPDGCTLPGEPAFAGVRAAARADSGADAGADAVATDASPTVTDASFEADAPNDAGVAKVGARLALGAAHTCAVLADGSVKCWGFNNNGHLGIGDATGRGLAPGQMGAALPAVDLGVGSKVVEVGAGAFQTCARLEDGAVRCWGRNPEGQLGYGDTAQRGSAPDQMGQALPNLDLGIGPPASVLAMGLQHACAIGALGVKCWGYNVNAQLGIGDTANRGDGPGEMGGSLPLLAFTPARAATQLALGSTHSCALFDSGAVKCWGTNGLGQLGLGDTTPRGDSALRPTSAVPDVDLGGGLVLRIAAGANHTCACRTDGVLKCWGAGGNGQLGLGDNANRGDGPNQLGAFANPVKFDQGRKCVDVAAGSGHTCVLMDNGRVKCWGDNSSGQLGLGDTLQRGGNTGLPIGALPEVDLGTGRTVVELRCGGEHSCARLDNGDIKCWGRNGSGQLGLGDVTDRGNVPNQMGDALPAVLLK